MAATSTNGSRDAIATPGAVPAPARPLSPADADGAGLEVLDRPECLHLLARGGVGRIAINAGALP
jgi:hypothetical protein